MFDYHMHTEFSFDSKAKMEDMVKKSISLGLKEICITDHALYDILPTFASDFDYEGYFNNINTLNDKYNNDIKVKAGIELSLQDHVIELCSKESLKYDFDFVICSLHGVDKKDFFVDKYFNSISALNGSIRYYESLLNIVKKFKDYSVIGHLDVVRRYSGENLSDDLFEEFIKEILKTVIEDGKGIEINSSSFKYKLPDFTPSKNILSLYKDLGGEIITTGADAHTTKFVGDNFDKVYALLKEIGFDYVCTFDKKEPIFNKI